MPASCPRRCCSGSNQLPTNTCRHQAAFSNGRPTLACMPNWRCQHDTLTWMSALCDTLSTFSRAHAAASGLASTALT
jgi:hypothetical protein